MAMSRPQTASPTTPWVARVPLEHASAVATLRSEPGLVVCEDEQYCWIRPAVNTSSLKDAVSQRLRWLVVAELMHVTPTNMVIPWGKRVPTGHLPTGTWTPLTELFSPTVPAARFAAQHVTPTALTFVPSETIVAPTLLRLSLSEWQSYVATAPNVRLARWEFAANRHDEVLVHGTPLPPLPGRHYWEAEGLLVPCGWHWSPAVSADIVRRVLHIDAAVFALADLATSSWEIILPEAFVPARRQNVRGTVIAPTATDEAAS